MGTDGMLVQPTMLMRRKPLRTLKSTVFSCRFVNHYGDSMFEQTLASEEKSNISWTVFVAFGGELVLVTTLVLIPLIYLQALPRPQPANAIFLVPSAPPPPAPPPSPRA